MPPVTRTSYWLNEYAKLNEISITHASEKGADKLSRGDRTARIELIFEDGRMVDFARVETPND